MMNFRRLTFALLLGGFTMAVSVVKAAEDPLPQAPVKLPVVVELFTSEGCANCPPAERILAALARDGIPGIDLITLEEHVDYLNDLGWRDRFSQEILSARQWRYANVLGSKQVYTPQVVVQGKTTVVGSDRVAIADAIKTAQKNAKVRISLDKKPAKPGQLTFAVSVQKVSSDENLDADVFLILKEENLSAKPSFGENAGQQLEHSSVVRYFRWIGKIASEPSICVEHSIAQRKAWKSNDLSVVVLVQSSADRQIIGAITASLH